MSTVAPADVLAFFRPILAQDAAGSAAGPATGTVVPPGMAPPTTTTGTTTAPGAQTGTESAAPRPGAGSWIFPVMMLGVLVLMIVMTSLAGRKQKKQREQMMASLKRGEKVLTSGGVIGHVVDMHDDEVVLRVEEGRVRFAKSAIQAVLSSKGSSIAETKGADKTVGV